MGALRDTVGDYFYHFRLKDTKGKIKEIRLIFIRAALIGAIIATPWIINLVHSRIARQLYDANLQDLTEDQRWARVRDGLDRIECDSDAGDQLSKQGLSLSTPDGVEYAVHKGLCRFVLNDERPPAAAHMFFQ